MKAFAIVLGCPPELDGKIPSLYYRTWLQKKYTNKPNKVRTELVTSSLQSSTHRPNISHVDYKERKVISKVTTGALSPKEDIQLPTRLREHCGRRGRKNAKGGEKKREELQSAVFLSRCSH